MKKIWLVVVVVLIAIIGFVGGQKYADRYNNPDDNTVAPIDQNTQEITLYFTDANAEYLIAEKRVIKKTEDINELALTALNELIKGSEKNLKVTVNPDTKINSVKVENGICYIDFQPGFQEKNTGGTTREIFFIYAIANTLTEFEEINEIKILSGDEVVNEFGHFILDESIKRDPSRIQK